MAVAKKSFRHRMGKFLQWLNPLKAGVAQRLHGRFPPSGFLPLCERQTTPIVAQLVGLFRSLFGAANSRRLGVASGASRCLRVADRSFGTAAVAQRDLLGQRQLGRHRPSIGYRQRSCRWRHRGEHRGGRRWFGHGRDLRRQRLCDGTRCAGRGPVRRYGRSPCRHVRLFRPVCPRRERHDRGRELRQRRNP